jgi:hypothetical protein
MRSGAWSSSVSCSIVAVLVQVPPTAGPTSPRAHMSSRPENERSRDPPRTRRGATSACLKTFRARKPQAPPGGESCFMRTTIPSARCSSGPPVGGPPTRNSTPARSSVARKLSTVRGNTLRPPSNRTIVSRETFECSDSCVMLHPSRFFRAKVQATGVTLGLSPIEPKRAN